MTEPYASHDASEIELVATKIEVFQGLFAAR
jgi:hypothetical protein